MADVIWTGDDTTDRALKPGTHSMAISRMLSRVYSPDSNIAVVHSDPGIEAEKEEV